MEVAATGPVKMAAADSLVLTTTLVVTAPVEVAETGSIEAAAGPVEVAVVDMVMTSVADDEGSRTTMGSNTDDCTTLFLCGENRKQRAIGISKYKYKHNPNSCMKRKKYMYA